MSEVRLSSIVSVLRRIKGTNSKNEKVSLAAEFLAEIPEDQIADTARLMIGQTLPDEYGSPGIQFSDMGDLGSIGSQTTLFSENLTVEKVVDAFKQIYSTAGARSRQRKSSVLRGIMIHASKDEIEFIIGCITGDIRAGFSEGLLIEAIAKASNRDSDEIKESLGVIADIGRVAEQALRDGKLATSSSLVPMNPIRVMLAESAENISKAIDLISAPFALEYKLDGIRVQIHISHGDIRIFSRRLTDITDALPEVVNAARSINVKSAILDGEVIAFKKGPLPFQEVMRRITREKGIADEAKKTPVRLYLFDSIYFDERLLIDQSYDMRTKMLADVVPNELLVPRIMNPSETEAEEFQKKSLSEGHEGLLVKRLSGKYHLGKRSKDWIKVKEHVTIDAVIIAAEWGHGRRSNWLSNYYLGVRKPGGYAMIGKTFKGVTDEELKYLTDRLLSSVENNHGHWVQVIPRIVVEIAFNEIQRSQKYESGMALRFARVVRIRDEKDPEDATTEDEIKQIMERQFSSKAKRMK